MAHVECIQCRENGKKKDIHISIYFSVAEYIFWFILHGFQSITVLLQSQNFSAFVNVCICDSCFGNILTCKKIVSPR